LKICSAIASGATSARNSPFITIFKQIILERSDVADALAGQYVEPYDFHDRPLEIRWKGLSLPYRVFSKDQRVSQTAIVDNKRLGHALALVKAQQDLRQAPKVMNNSEKTGYQKRVRKIYGPGFGLDAIELADDSESLALQETSS
jgi:hypothetical protein